MKRLFYLLMMLSCTLWSCSKSDGPIDDPDNPDNPDTPTNVMLDISVSDLVFEAEGGEKEFTIYCNSDWTITNESEWCKTNVTQGNGNSKIIVTVGVYSEMEDRNTNLTIKAGNITKVLTVTQKDGDAIILSKDKFDIPEEGGNVTVEVKSNIQYEVSIPSQFQNWIKHEPETKSITVKNFTFKILENKEYEKREGYIVFNGNSLKDTVHIYQTVDPRTLILSKDTYNISSAKESIEVELKSNVDYSISIPSSASHWIKLLKTKAIRTDKIYFEIEENTTYDNRSAQIFIKDKNSSLCDTLYINQLQQNALILSQKQYEVLAGGERISIEVQSNIDYEIIIPKTVQEWIEQIPQSKALTESLINLEVKPNPTDDVRSAQVFIKDKNSTLSDTVQITQAAKGTYTGDIIFETEQDLIDFQTAGYTKVIGNIIVQGNKIRTLQKLDNLLTEIDGNLTIDCDNLTSLDGLYNLKKITGNFTTRNIMITSYEGIGKLTEIGGDFELNAKSYVSSSVHYPSSLNSLASFEGLESLETIGGNFKVIAESSSSSLYSSSFSLSSLSSFKGLSGLKSIGGDFEVKAKSSSSLDALASFEGLENLQTIGGSFSCNKRISTKSLSQLNSIGKNLEIRLLFDEGLENLVRIGGDFKPGSSSSFKTLNKLSSIGGNFYAILFEGTSFEGLESLTNIGGGKLTIKNCSSLNNIDALKNIESLNDISITECSKLYDFCVLKNVVQNMSGTFYLNKNGYNPTKYQLLNGECSQIPQE